MRVNSFVLAGLLGTFLGFSPNGFAAKFSEQVTRPATKRDPAAEPQPAAQTQPATQSRISAQMLFRQAPVPNSDSRRDLLLTADRPNDVIVTAQRPSFRNVDQSQALLNPTQISQAYRKHLGQAASDQVLARGYRVIGNFVDGLKNKRPFEAFNPADPSELWQLVLPNTTTVSDVILQMEWFRSSIGGHAQIRFKLSNPLLLISQETQQTKFVQGDVVYALMALRTENGNQNWNAVTGLTGAFASSYMLATAEHMAHRQLREDDSSLVEQYRLNLTDAQKQNLFSYALQVGPRVGEREIYNLIYNSCINAALRAIKTIDTKVDAWEFNPYQVIPQLMTLGLIKEGLPSANDEFQSPIRVLEEPANAATLQTISKLQDVMATKTFEESIRTLAATIIEDAWTTAELNTALEIASIAIRDGKKVNAQKEILLSQVVFTHLKAVAIANPQLSARSQASVRRLVTELTAVLKRNQLEVPELMAYLKQSSLTAR